MCVGVYPNEGITWRDRSLDGTAEAFSSLPPVTLTLLTRPGEPRRARKAAEPPASTKNAALDRLEMAVRATRTLPISLTWHWSTRIARRRYDIKHIVLQVFIPQGDSNQRPRR